MLTNHQMPSVKLSPTRFSTPRSDDSGTDRCFSTPRSDEEMTEIYRGK